MNPPGRRDEPNNTAEEYCLTVEYALTRREIFQFFLYSFAKSPKFRGTILSYSAIIGILTLLIRAIPSRSLTLKDVICAVAYAVGFIVFIAMWVFIRGKTAKRTLTVSGAGISTEIGRLRGQIPWEKVEVITDTPQFVLIARTNGNALVIPNRAFSGPEHRSQFLSKIKGWMPATT